MNKLKIIKIVKKLTEKKQTISAMESATGGCFTNELTNIEGASSVIKYSAITYSNEYKIKMGIKASTIEKYTVYSEEVAKEMSKKITEFTNSDYGVGITGKLRYQDINNQYGSDDMVFISVYDKNNDKYYTKTIKSIKETRSANKKLVVEKIFDLLYNII